MKANRITLVVSIILLTATSVALYAYIIKSQGGLIQSRGSDLILTGVLKSKTFPTISYGPWTVGAETSFQNTDVLVMEKEEANTSKIYYLYSLGFHREMLGANAGGNGYVHGLTLDEIHDAYLNGLDVEVYGTPFRLSRGGNEYDLLDVAEIKILDRSKAPLVVYHSVNSTGTYSYGSEGFGRVSLPQDFVVDRTQLTYGAWKMRQQIYSILLSKGDAVGFEFSSTRPINFRILAPSNQTLPVDRSLMEWYVAANTTSQNGAFVALRSGEYWFVFDSDRPSTSNVTLNAWRIPWDPAEVLLMESVSSGGPMGGVSSFGFYHTSTPKIFTVGRTWYGSSWTDHSWRFEADLSAGDVLSFEFNSTEPISFQLSDGVNVILKTADRYSLKQNYPVPSTGGYVFDFEIEKQKTAIVSFSCRHNPEFPQTNQPALWVDQQNLGKQSITTFLPPSVSTSTWITGKLGDASLPSIKGRVMTITGTITKPPITYFLQFGEDDILPAPTGGFTLLGDYNLYDLNEAYLQGLDVQLEGIPFDLTLGNSTVEGFHINSVTIRDRAKLPILGLEFRSIVSGFQSFSYGGGNLAHFPTEFSLGFDYYTNGGETIYGNPEYFFHIRLLEGQAIRIIVNATNPIVLGIYREGDHPVTLSFGNASPSNYVFYEAGKQIMDIPFGTDDPGYITIAMKAYGGEKTQVQLNVEWSVTD